MSFSFKIVTLLSMLCTFSLCARAQNSVPASPRHKRASRGPTTAELESQMQQMHDELQAEIDALKHELGVRDAQLQAARAAQTAQTSTEQEQRSAAAAANAAEVASVKDSVQKVQEQDAATAAAVTKVQTTVAKDEQTVEHPAALHYKGITLVPGGFLAGESVWRQRAMNADIYTNWNSTPYLNAGEAHVSEWVPTARQSRISLLAAGTVPFGTIRGYVEGDFLSAGTTSNNTQSNSYTLRVRQAWAQAEFGRMTFTGGQMWTLMTEDKKGAAPGQEWAPLFFDANLHVGYSYIRQTGFRVTDALTPKVTLAAAIENAQYQFSASNAPSNFFFGAPGAAGGLNNPDANYSDQAAPDVTAKVSFDPGYGHYEVGGVLRFFRDRYYPGGTGSAGATNDTKMGGGLLLNASFPITRKVQTGFHLLAGDGTGRYGASLLPDVTVHPNGTLEPIRNAQALFSLDVHPTGKLDLFGYAGTEYAQRTYYVSSSGTLVGYAPPSLSDTGCNTEAMPTGGTGVAPGTSGCAGPTRDLVQGSIGWLYRAYSGPAGRLQYGFAYSHLVKNGWYGVGGAPRTSNNLFYTSFRYYIP